MIDMHIHTTNSDGTDTVIEILKKAENLKLNTISITDHENCNSYEDLEKINIKEYYSGKIIPGIELKSQYKDITMDILGYGIDHKKMKKYLAECYANTTREKIQDLQLKEFYEIGIKNNLKLRPIEELKWDKSKDWASCTFYDEMKTHAENKEKLPQNIWEDFLEFKKDYHSKTGIFYMDRAKYYPSIEKIIEVIHKSGGKAFVAHIYEYKEIENKISELEEITQKYNIDGIECYYTNFTPQEHKEVLKFTQNHNLLTSGGSDYHGTNKPGIELGTGKGTLEIPDEIIENWDVNYVR